MIYFYKHPKSIAYFLITLILCQSCVVYNSHHYTVNEASQYNKGRIKIKTTDGAKIKLPWIEDINGNATSILKTKRVTINKRCVEQIVKFEPDPGVIPLDSALNYQGRMEVLSSCNKNELRRYEFIKITAHEDYINGYKLKGKDTVTVFIPNAEIEKIKVVSKPGSIILNLIGVIPLSGVIWYISVLSQMGGES